MNSVAESPRSGPTGPQGDRRSVGVVTRAISWVLDAIAINAVAIGAGLGVQLVLSIFPASRGSKSTLEAIGGAVYGVWCAAYFVVLWSWTGQTLGARTMQIRLLTANRSRVKPARALVRWVGMNLAMLPLFAGFAPILVGRRGLPDWLARTVVVHDPPRSLVEARPATARSASRDGRARTPATSRGSEPATAASSDDGGRSREMDGERSAVATPGRAEPTG